MMVSGLTRNPTGILLEADGILKPGVEVLPLIPMHSQISSGL